MNRARLLAEIPPAMGQWLAAHGTDATWESVARDLAVALGRRLLAGDPGSNPLLITVHQTAASAAVRHVASALGGGRPWSANRVASALGAYLELYSATFELRRRLVQTAQPISLVA